MLRGLYYDVHRKQYRLTLKVSLWEWKKKHQNRIGTRRWKSPCQIVLVDNMCLVHKYVEGLLHQLGYKDVLFLRRCKKKISNNRIKETTNNSKKEIANNWLKVCTNWKIYSIHTKRSKLYTLKNMEVTSHEPQKNQCLLPLQNSKIPENFILLVLVKTRTNK